MLLSYLEAFREKQNGNISWEEYIHHLLIRCTSDENEHEDDDVDGPHWELLKNDPFAYSIFCWSRRVDKIPGEFVVDRSEGMLEA